MEYLNNFNIITSIQNFAVLQQIKAVKCAITVIFCVELDIEMKSSCPKEPSLLDNVWKVDHYINIVMTTAFVNKNSNFRHLMIITI